MKIKLIWIMLSIALLLRLVYLTQYPFGFNADEASFGYDSYSILQTGKDQWGNPFPLFLKSFGDYKLPLYSYLDVPFVSIFGLSEFSVRLPNAFVGVGGVLVVYLLAKEMRKRMRIKGEYLETISALFIAISPWSIMLSRAAIESNLMILLLPLGICFFLKGLKSQKYLIYSSAIFGLNLYSYHASRVITPIILIVLILVFRKSLKKIKRQKLFIVTLPFLILSIGMVYTFTQGAGSRVSERSIFQGAIEEGARSKIQLIQTGTNPIVAQVLHNKYQVALQRFISNYQQYLSYQFLISMGAGESYYAMIPGIGVVYITQIVLLVGVIYLLFQKEYRGLVILLLLWLLVSPIPAAAATGVGYSGTRSQNMLPVLAILSAVGLYGWSLIFFKINKNIKFLLVLCLGILLSIEVANFVNKYAIIPANDQIKSMNYGNLDVAIWLKNNYVDSSVKISRSLSEPQIFIAFVNKWDAQQYQYQTKMWNLNQEITWVDQLPSWNLGRYTFGSIDWENDSSKYKLIVGRPEEFPKSIKPVYTSFYPDKTPNILIVDPNEEK